MKMIDDAKKFLDAWNEDDAKPAGVTSAKLGSGMAQQAADTLKSRPYQLHLEESKALGEKPMTPEAFSKARKS